VTGVKIGDHLRAARKAAGLSTEVSAKKLRLSMMSLNRYENNHRLPDASTLLSMAKLYKCELVSLMTGATATEKPVPVPVRGKMASRLKFDLDLQKEPEEHLPFLTDNPSVYAVKVFGSEMQPAAYHNEYLILERPEAERFLEITRGEHPELVRGRSVGKLLGVFRKA
jgi:transcriptional regulator with XRE-family HTH domain